MNYIQKKRVKLVLLGLGVIALYIYLLGVMTAHADVNDQVRAYRDGLFADLKALSADKEALDKEIDQLKALSDSFKAAVKNYNEQTMILKSDIADYDAEAKRHTEQADIHNANPCSSPPGQNLCAQYDANAARLNAWRSKLAVTRDKLQKRWNDLDWSRKQTEKQGESIKQQANNYDKKVAAWNLRREKLAATLAEYNRLTQNCIDIIKSGRSDEAISLGCGVFFDGSDPKLPSLESLGIQPGTKGWPGIKVTPNK